MTMPAMTAVESTNLKGIAYDDEAQVLRIWFLNGATWDYAGVPAALYQELADSPAKGKFFHRNVRNAFNGMKVQSAPEAWPTKTEQCRRGTFTWLEHDVYLGRALDLYGEFSEGEVALFDRLLKPGDTVIEVGANIGALTVPLAQIVGSRGLVLAFEPQRVVFDILEQNIKQNDVGEQVRPLMFAAGAERGGSMPIAPINYGVEGSFGSLSLVDPPGGAVPDASWPRVLITTIDHYARSTDLTRVNLIKLDCEGMEAHAIRGGRACIARDRPFLYFENDRKARSPELLAFVRDTLGYRMWWHMPPIVDIERAYKNAGKVFPSFDPRLCSMNVIAVPEENTIATAFRAESGYLPEITGPDSWWEDIIAAGGGGEVGAAGRR